MACLGSCIFYKGSFRIGLRLLGEAVQAIDCTLNVSLAGFQNNANCMQI